jgi:two-component system KDP operon response regulator KdpE
MPIFEIGALSIDFSQRRVRVGGRDIDLTPQEFRLVYQLALHQGRVLMHEDLLQRIWGDGYQGQTEVLHTTVARLRRKLEEDPARPRYILTTRGVGYFLAKVAPTTRVV